MMVIRREQLDAMSVLRWAEFERRATAHLCGEAVDVSEVERAARMLRHARRWFRNERDIVRCAQLLRKGWRAEGDELPGAALQILASSKLLAQVRLDNFERWLGRPEDASHA
jgi:hypothetical protein